MVELDMETNKSSWSVCLACNSVLVTQHHRTRKNKFFVKDFFSKLD